MHNACQILIRVKRSWIDMNSLSVYLCAGGFFLSWRSDEEVWHSSIHLGTKHSFEFCLVRSERNHSIERKINSLVHPLWVKHSIYIV